MAYNEPGGDSLRSRRDILSIASYQKKRDLPQSTTVETQEFDANFATKTASTISDNLHDFKVGSDITTRSAHILLFVAYLILISMSVLKYRAASRYTETGQTDLEFMLIPAEESDINEEEDRLLYERNASLANNETFTINDLSEADDEFSEDCHNRENEA